MPNAKDKAFHADGSMTAAEYKRRFLNKAAVKRAASQVELRTNIGRMKGVPKAVTQRLRNVHIRSEMMPGDFYKPGNERAARNGEAMRGLKPGANKRHIATTI